MLKNLFAPKVPVQSLPAPPGQKVHFTWKGMYVTSDVRDQCIDGKLDAEVHRWCEEAGINAEIHLKLDGNTVWRIRDDDHRLMFILRWGQN